MGNWVKLRQDNRDVVVNLEHFDQVWVRLNGARYELQIRSAEAGTQSYFFAPKDASEELLSERWSELASVAGVSAFGQEPLFTP
jgi:hypothetical protein